jgi:hypothetical protein
VLDICIMKIKIYCHRKADILNYRDKWSNDHAAKEGKLGRGSHHAAG